MWIFLITEVMMFGGLFSAYTVYRLSYPQAFDMGSAEMEIILGAINTARAASAAVSPWRLRCTARRLGKRGCWRCS